MTKLPIEDACVRRYAGSTNWVVYRLAEASAKVVTDSDGYFSLESLSYNGGSVIVYKRGYKPTIQEVPSGSNYIEVALDIGGTIRGQILSADGSPPIQPRIDFHDLTNGTGSSASLKNDTKFEFEGLNEGKFLIWATAEQGASETCVIELSRNESVTDIRLIASGLGRLSGSIHGLEAGEWATVQLIHKDPPPYFFPMHNPNLRIRKTINGDYSMHGIPDGDYWLGASTNFN